MSQREYWLTARSGFASLNGTMQSVLVNNKNRVATEMPEQVGCSTKLGGIMSFQIHALSPAQFEPLFSMSQRELAKAQAIRMVVDARPGFPCRVSLADAEIGEKVILVNFMHQSGESPYQATHAIFVREHARQAFPEVGAIPESLQCRLISIRAFDDKHWMIDADVVEGSCLNVSIPLMLQDPKVSYLHLHNAKPGCFAARVTRALAD